MLNNEAPLLLTISSVEVDEMTKVEPEWWIAEEFVDATEGVNGCSCLCCYSAIAMLYFEFVCLLAVKRGVADKVRKLKEG